MKKLVLIIMTFVLLCLFPSTALQASTVDPRVFSIDGNNVLTGYNGTGGIVEIPNGVKTIGKKAFAGNKVITSVTMPDSVTVIEESAFDSCASLEKVVFSKKLKTIENNAFWGCTSLKTISLPSSLNKVGVGAFCQCDQLLAVEIPKSVTEINKYAFGYMCINAQYFPTIDFKIVTDKNTAASEYAAKYEIPCTDRNGMTVSGLSVKKSGSKKMTISWKKNSKISGYQIQYSTSSKFAANATKTITLTNDNSKKTISKLKSGKKYYVRIRGYINLSTGKDTIDSKWSSTKKVTL